MEKSDARVGASDDDSVERQLTPPGDTPGADAGTQAPGADAGTHTPGADDKAGKTAATKTASFARTKAASISARIAATDHTKSPPASGRRVVIATIFVGLWHVALAVGTTLQTLLWWPVVEEAASSTYTWYGWTFTSGSAVLLLAIVGGVAGSLVHTITIFSSRVGRSTFETSYVWWCILRPIAAALLALIFAAALSSNLLALSGGNGESAAALAFVGGALAGLFTDAVLQKLRHLLGATSTQHEASKQKVPLAAPPEQLTLADNSQHVDTK